MYHEILYPNNASSNTIEKSIEEFSLQYMLFFLTLCSDIVRIVFVKKILYIDIGETHRNGSELKAAQRPFINYRHFEHLLLYLTFKLRRDVVSRAIMIPFVRRTSPSVVF